MPKININGVTREMTAEEIAEMERLAAAMPGITQTDAERMDQIEAALIELAALIAGGETGG